VVLDPVARLATAVFVVARYVTLLILPVGLDAHYPYAPYESLWSPVVIVAGLIVMVVGLAVRRLYRSNSRHRMAIVWTFVTLLPVLAFGRFGDVIMADRFLYIPSMGFAVLFASGVAWLRRDLAPWQRGHVPVVIASVILALFCVAGIKRCRVWRDDLPLFSNMVETSPASALVRNNLGQALYDRGRQDEAVIEFREAIRLEPEYAMAHNNLASALEMKGELLQAVPHYFTALRLAPGLFEARVNAGHLLVQLGDTDRGLEMLREVTDDHPRSTKALYALAHALDETNRGDEALPYLRRVSQENPEFPNAHYLRGKILLERGLPELAAASMRTFLDLWPHEDEHRAAALAMIGGRSETSDLPD
jgi:Flp pilus assembly protein TadD